MKSVAVRKGVLGCCVEPMLWYACGAAPGGQIGWETFTSSGDVFLRKVQGMSWMDR